MGLATHGGGGGVAEVGEGEAFSLLRPRPRGQASRPAVSRLSSHTSLPVLESSHAKGFVGKKIEHPVFFLTWVSTLSKKKITRL